MSERDGFSDQIFASVWDALEDSPAEASNMRLRSDLMIAIQQAVATWDCTKADAARRFGTTQARLNSLLRGSIDGFSLDELTVFAARAGLTVHIRVERAAA